MDTASNLFRDNANADSFERYPVPGDPVSNAIIARLDTIIELLQRPSVESTTTINVYGPGDVDQLAEQIRERLIKVRQRTGDPLGRRDAATTITPVNLVTQLPLPPDHPFATTGTRSGSDSVDT